MWTPEVTSEEVLTIRDDEVKEGWERHYLLIGDVHWDNPKSQRDLFFRLLREAKARDARVFSFGDFFCAMQGRNDKRGNKGSVRAEDQKNAYFNSLVDNAAEKLQEFWELFWLLGDGNHETAIVKHNEVDLLDLLCHRVGVNHYGYSGFIRFMFSAGGKGNRSTRNLAWHHGSGGGGEMTKGVLRVVRQAAWLPDADIVVGAHTHDHWILPLPRVRLNDAGKVLKDEQYHVQVPTFKDEFSMRGGFHIEKGRPPKPLGGVWLRFFYSARCPGNVDFDLMRAK